jgi:hypothetical protein
MAQFLEKKVCDNEICIFNFLHNFYVELVNQRIIWSQTRHDSNEKSTTKLKTIPYAAVGTSSHQRE